jgi:uncharacterized protein (DUF2461 family)
LRAIRQHVIADASGFGKLIKNKKLIATYGGLEEESRLSRPPKGFDADVPHLEFVKLKNFIVAKEIGIKKKIPADLGKELALTFKDALPLVTWLRQVK